MKIRNLVLLALAGFAPMVARAQAQTAPEYYICETKTSSAEKWWFSSIFLGDPYRLKTAAPENAFTNYVIKHYRDTETSGIGPADCRFYRTRDEAEDYHSRRSKYAASEGNSVIETSWSFNE